MERQRILFTSAYRSREPFDFYGYHSRAHIRLSQPRALCPGLRFLRENLPQIEILELPTREEYARALQRGWDVVGFSFFTFETADVLEMAELARKAGVREVWAGNYGAMNPLIQDRFDKVVTGYAEAQVARALGVELGALSHPVLLDSLGVHPVGDGLIRTGWLYTARGCPLKCTFCQTPTFAAEVVKTPLESIERVLWQYRRAGVQLVLIFDENFGIAREHSREVVGMLRKLGLPWGVMTRTDVLEASFDEWYESGLVGVVIGIEAMNPANLEDVHKKLSVEQTARILERLNRHGLAVTGTYMIGFDRDDVGSVTADLRALEQLRPDFLKIYVVTPYPQTPLWSEIEQRYGIDVSDWSRFDGKHLVWNHPRLSRQDAQELLALAYRTFNSEDHVHRFVSKLHQRLVERRGPLGAAAFFLAGLREKVHAGLFQGGRR